MSASVGFDESTHVYEREIRFYREVAPRTGIRVPRLSAARGPHPRCRRYQRTLATMSFSSLRRSATFSSLQFIVN